MMNSIATAEGAINGTAARDALGNYVQPGDTVCYGTRSLYTVIKVEPGETEEKTRCWFIRNGEHVETAKDIERDMACNLLDLTALATPARVPKESYAEPLRILLEKLEQERMRGAQVTVLIMEKKYGDRILHAFTVPGAKDLRKAYTEVDAGIGQSSFWTLYPSSRDNWRVKHVKKTPYSPGEATDVYWMTAQEESRICSKNPQIVDAVQYNKIKGRPAIVEFFKSEYGIDIGKGTTLFI